MRAFSSVGIGAAGYVNRQRSTVYFAPKQGHVHLFSTVTGLRLPA